MICCFSSDDNKYETIALKKKANLLHEKVVLHFVFDISKQKTIDFKILIHILGSST